MLPILIRRSKDQVLTWLLQRLDKNFFMSTHAKVTAHVTREAPASESRPTEERGLRTGTCASAVPLHVNAVNYQRQQPVRIGHEIRQDISSDLERLQVVRFGVVCASRADRGDDVGSAVAQKSGCGSEMTA